MRPKVDPSIFLHVQVTGEGKLKAVNEQTFAAGNPGLTVADCLLWLERTMPSVIEAGPKTIRQLTVTYTLVPPQDKMEFLHAYLFADKQLNTIVKIVQDEIQHPPIDAKLSAGPAPETPAALFDEPKTTSRKAGRSNG